MAVRMICQLVRQFKIPIDSELIWGYSCDRILSDSALGINANLYKKPSHGAL